MTEALQDNRRIAKNTLMLYIRMVLIMGVTLFTSRIVLEQLGVENYGVYVVIGGSVAMLSFINSSMTTSTQRYLNFELGKLTSTEESLKLVFSTSLRIHLYIALIVLTLGETLGLWFINNKLVIPSSSMMSANVVYQTALAIFCISIIQVPFNAVIIAHEKMQIYAIISVVEAVLKLGVAYGLILIPGQKLAFYGLFLLCVQLMVASLYIFVSMSRFKECVWSVRSEKGLFKEMSGFAGWNIFGSIAWLVRGQGLGIILNMFLGPLLNAAKGIADQVSTAVSSLNSNFQVALNPQITKNYAAHHLKEMELLAYRGVKYATLLQWLISLPIMICTTPILMVWLGKNPEYSSLFIVLVLIDGLVGNLFGSPIMASLSATGRIKIYQIVVSSVLMMILPASYIALRVGWPPQSVFYLNITFNLLAGITRFSFCKRYLGYSFRYYLKYVLGPIILVVILSPIIPIIVSYFVHSLGNFLYILVIASISIVYTMSIIWWIAINKHEKESIMAMIKQKIK